MVAKTYHNVRVRNRQQVGTLSLRQSLLLDNFRGMKYPRAGRGPVRLNERKPSTGGLMRPESTEVLFLTLSTYIEIVGSIK